MDEYLAKLKNAKVLIQDTIDKLNNDKIEKELEEESEKYEFETEDEFRNRFDDSDAWDTVEQDDTMGDMEYSSLCNGDDCWYKGNSDRLSGCIIYRMIGADDLLLCDMCQQNHRNMENYIDNHANEFNQNGKLKRKAKKILNKVTSTEFKVSYTVNKDDEVNIDNVKKVKLDDWDTIIDVLPSLGYEIREETIYHVSKKLKNEKE